MLDRHIALLLQDSYAHFYLISICSQMELPHLIFPTKIKSIARPIFERQGFGSILSPKNLVYYKFGNSSSVQNQIRRIETIEEPISSKTEQKQGQIEIPKRLEKEATNSEEHTTLPNEALKRNFNYSKTIVKTCVNNNAAGNKRKLDSVPTKNIDKSKIRKTLFDKVNI